MSEPVLSASTGHEQADRILRGVVGIYRDPFAAEQLRLIVYPDEEVAMARDKS